MFCFYVVRHVHVWQNNTEELFSLLNYVDEDKFPSLEEFLVQFGDIHSASELSALQSALRPYLLRRVKEDVEKDIPPREETVITV